MAGTTSSDHEPVHFFRLSPELRNKVYGYYFEDPYENADVNFLEACKFQLAPHADLTLVCKQLRCETLGLYRQATTEFWTGHAFFVGIDGWAEQQDLLGEVQLLKKLLEVNDIPELSELSFKITWRRQDLPSTIIAQAAEDHGVYWHCKWSGAYSLKEGKTCSDLCNVVLASELRKRSAVAVSRAKLQKSSRAPANLKLDIVECMDLVRRECFWLGFDSRLSWRFSF